jgi:hypothetical protein
MPGRLYLLALEILSHDIAKVIYTTNQRWVEIGKNLFSRLRLGL